MATLRDLRRSRGLRLVDLPGGYRYNSDLERGRVMPGPLKLQQLAKLFNLPATEVWAACEASRATASGIRDTP